MSAPRDSWFVARAATWIALPLQARLETEQKLSALSTIR